MKKFGIILLSSLSLLLTGCFGDIFNDDWFFDSTTKTTQVTSGHTHATSCTSADHDHSSTKSTTKTTKTTSTTKSTSVETSTSTKTTANPSTTITSAESSVSVSEITSSDITTTSVEPSTSSTTEVQPSTSIEPSTSSTTSIEPSTSSSTTVESSTSSITSVEPSSSSSISSATSSSSESIITSASSSSSNTTSSTSSTQPISIDDEFKIYFLELGSWYTGDSIFIKAGNNDILIDAGSKQSSGSYIANYLTSNNLVTDNKLEYVISTHCHEDHIAGFVGSSKSGTRDGIFYTFEIGTFIQFSNTDKDATKGLYKTYLDGVSLIQSLGTTVYTALELSKSSTLKTISLGKDMSMTTLYQKYYEEKSDTENNYSVCTLFTYKNHHFLFTGDLEKTGEISLVDNNTLPHCELYKAGHHGSKTSSSNELLSVIQPDVVCVCCCCGSDEYTDVDANQFPTQEMINRVAPYTDAIYVTSISTDNDNKTYASMNGVICFSSTGAKYTVSCSKNNKKLKDTDWFASHRTWPSS